MWVKAKVDEEEIAIGPHTVRYIQNHKGNYVVKGDINLGRTFKILAVDRDKKLTKQELLEKAAAQLGYVWESDEEDPNKPEFPLVTNKPGTCPIITCELVGKRYCLFVLYPDKTTKRLEYHELENYCPTRESTYVDHDPNPRAVRNFADAINFEIDEVCYAMLVGDWVLAGNTFTS